MTFQLIVRNGPHEGISRAEITRRLTRMMALLQLKKEDVSFVLTNDEDIHQLNKIFRKIDRPTDVLAFAMREGEFKDLAGALLGDVVVSVETARKQALRAKKDLLSEMTMLLAHGLLHLLGWDHDTKKKDREMRAETSRLCAAAEKMPSSRKAKAPAKRGAGRPSKKGA